MFFFKFKFQMCIFKMFRPRLKIPYRSKVIVKGFPKVTISAHFLSDYGSGITGHQRLFYLEFDFEMIDLTILGKYSYAKFMSKTLDFHFYAPPSAHNWIPYFA